MTCVTSEKIQDRDPATLSEKYMQIWVNIRRATLDAFWIREPGTVKGKLTMVKRLGTVTGDKLVLDTCLPHIWDLTP